MTLTFKLIRDIVNVKVNQGQFWVRMSNGSALRVLRHVGENIKCALLGNLTLIDHTPSGPTLGGYNTGSTIAGALLGTPGENVPKLGTIMPLSYQPLFWKFHTCTNKKSQDLSFCLTA